MINFNVLLTKFYRYGIVIYVSRAERIRLFLMQQCFPYSVKGLVIFDRPMIRTNELLIKKFKQRAWFILLYRPKRYYPKTRAVKISKSRCKSWFPRWKPMRKQTF